MIFEALPYQNVIMKKNVTIPKSLKIDKWIVNIITSVIVHNDAVLMKIIHSSTKIRTTNKCKYFLI